MSSLLLEVSTILDMHNVVTAIHYGNRNGRDDDVFLITYGSRTFSSAVHGRLDIAAVGETWVPCMVSNLDPQITEPLLGGRVIFGSQADEWTARLARTRPDEETADYLAFHSRMFLEWARLCADEGRFNDALENLGFAASFAAFNVYYQTHPRAVRLKHLMRYWKHPALALLRQIRGTIKEEIPNLAVTYNVFANKVASHLTYVENQVCLL